MRTRPSLRSVALAACTSAVVPLVAQTTAEAHMVITSHETRYGMVEIKDGPCGRTAGERSENVYTYTAGERITLEWDEYIPHPGYYRIAFDDDGDDDFVDPADYDDLFTNETVLRDGLFEHTRSDVDGPWSFELELPDTPCTNCTLQLVQMMTDKPPYEPGTNDLYYNCVDLVLLAPEGEDTAATADVVDDTTDGDDADVRADDDTTDGDDADVRADDDTTDGDDAGADADESDAAPTVLVHGDGGGCAVTAQHGRGAGVGWAWVVGALLVAGRRRRSKTLG